ncbi:TetR/AcrR family transcriptional regulator [Staphylococcus debuckii]|uniref:TetR/AcrR family transcriptional regulator n=1 Tax=Staphylococcus debuckii TaxID=2044912 RepID=A0ABU9EX09_9STAP
MNPKDLRVVKTKRALSESLLSLLENKPFSSITVNMICEEALVHRTTFYKHFFDKYDLLSYLLHNLTQDYFDKDVRERIQQPFQSIAAFIDFPINKISEKQKHDAKFFETATSIFIDKLREDIENNRDKIEIDSNIPISLVARVFEASIQAMGEWNHVDNCYNINNENGGKLSLEKLDEIFNKLVNIKIKEDI